MFYDFMSFIEERTAEIVGSGSGLIGGALVGAKVGAGFGIAGGPLGAIAGTIPGAILGGTICALTGNKIGTEIDRKR